MKQLLIGIFLLFIIPLELTYAAPPISLSVEIEPSSGSQDDTFTYSVVVDGVQNSEAPELSPNDDFDVTLVGPQSSVQILNGRFSARVSYIYNLSPKKEGVLTTPAVKVSVDGKVYSAEGLAVTVQKTKIPSSIDSSDRYALRQVPAFTSVYVGEQLPLSLEILSKEEVQEIKLGDLQFDGFWWSDMGDLERGVKDINSERYRVFRYHKALFPLRTGVIELPSQRATIVARERTKSSQRGNMPDLFGMDPFGNGLFGDFLIARPVQITLRSNTVSIDVKPLPAKPANFASAGLDQVIVGKTQIKADFNDNPVKFGESKTVEYEIKSWGNINPLKELNLPIPPDVKSYKESPQISQSEVSGRLYSVMRLKVSLVPKYGGEVTIPALKLGYFNPDTGQYEEAASKELNFTVEGGPKKEQRQESADLSTQVIKADAQQSNQDTTNTAALPYEEPSTLEKLSKQVSSGLALLVITTVLVIALAILLLSRSLRNSAPLRKLKAKVTQARSVQELAQALRDYIGAKFKRDLGHATMDELRAIVKRESEDSDKLYHALAVIDEIDVHLFGGKNIGAEDFDELKRKTRQLTESIS